VADQSYFEQMVIDPFRTGYADSCINFATAHKPQPSSRGLAQTRC